MFIVKAYLLDGIKQVWDFETKLEADKLAIELIEEEDVSQVEVYELLSSYTKSK